MYDQPKLSDAEWALVIELLETEQGELPAEIHHSRSSTVREELRHRLDLVRHLLDRLHAAPTV
ncbi:MAG: hypothetical protein HUU20_11250 [Pirellulales bacterium]|nr:hypothetical protein [Pirellulales bacterium]